MSGLTLKSVCSASLFILLAGQATSAETIVERSPFLKHPGMLGTGVYAPLGKEAAFLDKIPQAGRETVSGYSEAETAFFKSDFFLKSNPDATPQSIAAKAPAFSLTSHVGEYVSWFGLLRKLEKSGTGYRLILQNKYSTGMTDLHIQTVSVFGAGDFDVFVHAENLDLLPLVLVKVYGKVIAEKDGRPEIEAEFVRYWNWMYFNFSDYGKDKNLSAFDRDLDLSKIRIYSSRVDPYYYPARIKATREQLDQIGSWLRDNRDTLNQEYQNAQK